MKNWLLLILGLALGNAFAQQNPILQSPNFSPADVNCTNPPNCIENSGIDDVATVSEDGWLAYKGSWYTSHGSPTPGTSSIWLWSYGGGGEGIYTCFNFENGKQYKLCITIRTDNPPGSLGYENQDALFYIQASNGGSDFFSNFPVNPNNQIIAAWHAVDQVETTYTYTFTANNNYNKLWLFPYMLLHAPTPVDQYSMNTFDVKIEEVQPAPALAMTNNTITVSGSPVDGHWNWTPTNLVATSNPDGTIISVTPSCTPQQITGTFVADCAICSNYTLQANIGSAVEETEIITDGPACEGEPITLIANQFDPGKRFYQWMQIIDSQPVALSNNAVFSGTDSPALVIQTSAELNGAQFYCVMTTVPENCTFNSQTVAVAVFQNPTVPTVSVVNPSGGQANGSITITSPIANTILYSIDEQEPQFQPNFDNLATGTYAISAINGSGCKSTIQVTLTEPTPLTGMIPKGISPNNDGSNDAFDLTGIGNISQVKIFNRYGVNVYSKAHYLNEWQGQTDKGKSLPAATYYYVIFFENGDAKTGWVYLQREI